jgi:lipopolysaccharide export system ATP-binding protein
MKHRLPKPKTDRGRRGDQTELPIEGESLSPEAERAPEFAEDKTPPAEDVHATGDDARAEARAHPPALPAGGESGSIDAGERNAPDEPGEKTAAEPPAEDQGSESFAPFSFLVPHIPEPAEPPAAEHAEEAPGQPAAEEESAAEGFDRHRDYHDHPEGENGSHGAHVVEHENQDVVISAEGEPKRPPPLPFQPLPNLAGHPADESAPLLIQTHDLVKQYGGRRVVNGVDIHVRAGEVVGLLGKNGAGKTTTFYMIVGLVAPTIGHVYMGTEDVTRMPMYRRARRGIGYLPQEESIFRKLSVEDNLLAILETLPMTEEERDARCDQLLTDFGLQHVRHNIAITLSGGEKRRVTIARALVTNPRLLLLDEPFSGVDPMAVHDIQEIILHLKERGLGVLITDHNVRETLSVVDRAYIIDEGRVLSQGSRDFLINDPVAREIYLGHRFSM